MPAPTTWANLQLCTVTDVKTYFRDLHRLMATESTDTTLNTQIESKIALVKSDVIRPHVVMLARTQFPAETDRLVSFARTRHEQYKSHGMRNDQLAGVGSLVSTFPSGEFAYEAFLNSNIGALKPRIWYNAGVPTSSSVTSTELANGDFCVDTTNWEMYINRGTDTATWVRFAAEDMIDFIHNPTELKRWAVLETVSLCLSDSSLRSFLNKVEWSIAVTELQKPILEQINGYKVGSEYIAGAKNTALSMLRFDVSGDGTLQNAENKAGAFSVGFA